jgi:hypothetical protein
MAGEEEMAKKPIRLNANHPADSLHESSRINYRKLYRVDHNIRVKDLGIVDIDSVQDLVRYFEESNIKITEDLKFNTSDLAKDGSPKGTQSNSRATQTWDSSHPKAITESEDQPLESPVTLTNELDIAEAHNNGFGELLFDFEP